MSPFTIAIFNHKLLAKAKGLILQLMNSILFFEFIK